GDGARVRFHFIVTARCMLGKAQPGLREREPEGLVTLVQCGLRHPQAVLRVAAVNVVGTHVDAPRYAAWAQTQPSNLGNLVASGNRDAKAFMSARRHTVQAPRLTAPRKPSLPPGQRPAQNRRSKGLTGGPRVHCQGGQGGYVRPPCPMPVPPPRTSWSFTAPTCTSTTTIPHACTGVMGPPGSPAS